MADAARKLVVLYVTSILAALAALIAYLLLFLAGAILLMPHPQFPEGIGAVSNSPWIPLWLVLVGAPVVLATAFRWTFRKMRARWS